jgi:L-threonylcarbamoyladenylate synthase
MKTLPATPKNIKRAAAIIRSGGVVVYPTETVYGLGCMPQDSEAAKRICNIKGRARKPLPLICSDIKEADRIVNFTSKAKKLRERFWPGPLTLVLPARTEYSTWVTNGRKTLAVRVPGHDVSRELARLSGGVVVSTSANKSGNKPHNMASCVVKEIGNDVDIILDGGRTPGGLPSTIVDMGGENPLILRKGPITSQQIIETLTS